MIDWTQDPTQPAPCNHVVRRDEQTKEPVFCGEVPVYSDGKCKDHTQCRNELPEGIVA